jgi:hypothetical protein
MTQLNCSCSQQSQIRPLHDADMIELKGTETSTSYGHEGRNSGRCANVVPRPVPHCKQHFSWDCGLACVFMVVKAFNAAALQSTPVVSGDLHESDYDKLRELCPTTSIWTVDLAHLLRRLGLDVCFLTTTLGPNPAYAEEGFYMEHLQEDELRVSQLFSEANTAGIALHQRSLSSQELQEVAMTGACLVIALVDKRKLDPWLLSPDLLCPTLLGGNEKGASEGDGGYTGHYVLIVGFDVSRLEFIVHDPATPVSELRVSALALDLARRSFGTDEDLLIVPCDRSVISRLLTRGSTGGGSTGGGSTEQEQHKASLIQQINDDDENLKKSVMLQGPCSVTALTSSLASCS